MDGYSEKVVIFIDKSRKMLVTIISVIVVMIFIRSCINQIFDYKGEVEYLQKSLENLYGRIGNISECSAKEDIDTILLNTQKQLIGLIHETELRKSGENKNFNKEVNRSDRYDFALESIGGRIVSYHDSKLMYNCSTIMLLLGKCSKVNPPEKAIQSLVHPGEAFCFEGHQGSITIKLACDVLIDSITIEHVERAMTPKLNFSSAPKTILVTVMNQKHDHNGQEFGKFTFDPNVSNSQTFFVVPTSEKFKFIKINVTENHGDQNQTCIYRIQVHGHSDNC